MSQRIKFGAYTLMGLGVLYRPQNRKLHGLVSADLRSTDGNFSIVRMTRQHGFSKSSDFTCTHTGSKRRTKRELTHFSVLDTAVPVLIWDKWVSLNRLI